MLTKTPQAQRKSVNLSIDNILLTEAKALEINVSRAAEDGIAEAVRRESARRWKEENRDAVEGWNKWIEENGLPLAKYRQF